MRVSDLFFATPLSHNHLGLPFILANAYPGCLSTDGYSLLWIGAHGQPVHALYGQLKAICDQEGYILRDTQTGKLNLHRAKGSGILTHADLFHMKDAPYSHADLKSVERFLRKKFPTLHEVNRYDNLYSPSPHAA